MGPSLSVVLGTADEFATLATTVECLAAQTIHDRIELILVVATGVQDEARRMPLARFHSYQILTTDRPLAPPVIYALGARQARAPLVALGEDHAYPAPGWAAALVKAHEIPRAVVGPVILNANPDTAASWANLFMDYGEWLAELPPGPVRHLPGHNSCYRREILLACGDRLEEYMAAESLLHWELHAQGHELYLEPAAQTYHLNYVHAGQSLPSRYYAAAYWAGHRARKWSVWRRFVGLLSYPLVPPLRLWRLARAMHLPGRPRSAFWRSLPVLILFLVVSGLGEMAGYLRPWWDIGPHVFEMERRRTRYVTPAERAMLAQRPPVVPATTRPEGSADRTLRTLEEPSHE